jgi:hypothetical protein
MKKALLVLLLLAVAGGLFAQVTITGNVYGGLRATLADRGHNWALGWYNNNLGGSNQVRLNASYRNDDGTAGGNLSLRASSPLTGTTVIPFFHTYRGWFTMFDGALKILGGKWTEGEFCEGWFGATYWGYARTGIAAYFYPMDEFRVGFGVNSALAGTVETDLRYWLGVAYETDVFAVFAQGAFHKDDINALLSGGFSNDTIDFKLVVDLMRLDDFAEAGEVQLSEGFGFYGVENLDVELEAFQTFYGNADEDAEVSFGLYFGYYMDVGGIKKVGLDLGYDVTGKSFDFTPYLRFGVSASRNIVLNYTGTLGFDGDTTFTNAIGLSFNFSF